MSPKYRRNRRWERMLRPAVRGRRDLILPISPVYSSPLSGSAYCHRSCDDARYMLCPTPAETRTNLSSPQFAHALSCWTIFTPPEAPVIEAQRMHECTNGAPLVLYLYGSYKSHGGFLTGRCRPRARRGRSAELMSSTGGMRLELL